MTEILDKSQDQHVEFTDTSTETKIETETVISINNGIKKNNIELYQYQLNHVLALKNILAKTYFAFDLSMLGTGKTFTSSYIYNDSQMNFKHFIIICPVSVVSKWQFMINHYDVQITKIITYNS